MANSDASSSTTCTVRVLVSFYLVATNDSSNARTSHVPLSGDELKDLFNFVRHYLFLADTKGFWQFSMSQKTLERVVVLQSDPPPIIRIHSISALQEGSIAFTDQDSRMRDQDPPFQTLFDDVM